MFIVLTFIEIEVLLNFGTKLSQTGGMGLVVLLVVFLASVNWVLKVVGYFG